MNGDDAAHLIESVGLVITIVAAASTTPTKLPPPEIHAILPWSRWPIKFMRRPKPAAPIGLRRVKGLMTIKT